MDYSFSLRHDDFVHDVHFDYYGKRIATCSSDQMLRIWERTADLPIEQNTEWTCTQELGGKHKGAVWRVCWADPEFGPIIASCGNDQQICVYKEKENSEKIQSQKQQQ